MKRKSSHRKVKAKFKAKAFTDFLIAQAPHFDEQIMRDIRPTDGWLLNVSTGTTSAPQVTSIIKVTLWQKILLWFAKVLFSIGSFFRKASKKMTPLITLKPGPTASTMGTPVELTQDRFRKIWPNVTKPWKSLSCHDAIGNLVDPRLPSCYLPKKGKKKKSVDRKRD